MRRYWISADAPILRGLSHASNLVDLEAQGHRAANAGEGNVVEFIDDAFHAQSMHRVAATQHLSAGGAVIGNWGNAE